MSWDELGSILRIQRKVVPQLLRAGMDARIACGVVTTDKVREHIAPDAGKSPSTMAYQAMLAELDKVKRSKWGRKPEVAKCLELPGGMLSAMGQRVSQTFKLRPSFRGEQPIPVRKQETRVMLADGDIVVRVKLLSKGTIQLRVKAGRGRHWDHLRRIAAGELRHGSCSFVEDKRGRKRKRSKWYVMLSYEPPPRETRQKSANVAIIVHRGVHNALTMMATTGAYRTISGAKLAAQLRRLEARMRETRRIGREELGDGAKGHGKTRRYEHYDALQGKRARVVRTFCQQMGAAVDTFADSVGAGVVVIEDYGGIAPGADARYITRFPLYQLKEAIGHRLELSARELRDVPSEHISTTCPACECADERQYNRRTGTFHCLACRFERPADFVAALHMMRRAGVDFAVWDDRLEKYARLVAAVAVKGAAE